MTDIIIVDSCSSAKHLSEKMVKDGHTAMVIDDSKDLPERLIPREPKAVFLDSIILHKHGSDLISKIRKIPSFPEVIILTDRFDRKGAQLAIENEAWDYIAKQSSFSNIKLSLKNAFIYRGKKNLDLDSPPFDKMGIAGNSEEIRTSLDQSIIAAQSESNVLILGETGTGKELFAQAIHKNSARASDSFVVVDCAALPTSLVESILFGYRAGAFTGATKDTPGLIEQADGGVLFLDEIGELPVTIQKSFLRTIQERVFKRIGDTKERKSDFRLLAATNRNLKQMVSEGQFRKDLWFRIQGIIIDLPPLRERLEDIPEITRSYVSEYCRRYKITKKKISDDFLKALANHTWPGNVRELLNAINIAIAKANGSKSLFGIHLPADIRCHAMLSRFNQNEGIEMPPNPIVHENGRPPKLKSFLNNMRQHYLKELLACSDGQFEKACEISGLSRSHLYKLLNDHSLSSPR